MTHKTVLLVFPSNLIISADEIDLPPMDSDSETDESEEENTDDIENPTKLVEK